MVIFKYLKYSFSINVDKKLFAGLKFLKIFVLFLYLYKNIKNTYAFEV